MFKPPETKKNERRKCRKNGPYLNNEAFPASNFSGFGQFEHLKLSLII